MEYPSSLFFQRNLLPVWMCLTLLTAIEARELHDFTRESFSHAYSSWDDRATLGQHGTEVRAGDCGGGLVARTFNLSEDSGECLALTLQIMPENKEQTLQVRLVDANGNQGTWDFSLVGTPAGRSVTLLPVGAATIGQPARKKGTLNLRKVTQAHIQSSWYFGEPIAIKLIKLELRTPPDSPALAPSNVLASSLPIVIQDFTKDKLEAGFLAWKDHVKFEGGYTKIDASSGRGGALAHRKLDLSAQAQDTLALKLRVREGNTEQQLSIKLFDTNQNEGEWRFDLKNLKPGETAELIAIDGLSLKSSGGKGALDLAKINMLQVVGSWKENVMQAIDLVDLQTIPVTPEILASRITKGEKSAQEAADSVKSMVALDGIELISRGEGSPVVTHVCLVGPDMLALVIQSGTMHPGRVATYVPQAGDQKEVNQKNNITSIIRGKVKIGTLAGPESNPQMVSPPTYSGDRLQRELADHKENYTIVSPDDANYAKGLAPLAVFRKSKPNGFDRENSVMALHTLFLKLPRPFLEGKKYEIDMGRLNVRTPIATYVNNTRAVRSVAVHTSQIGYRPEDPFKRGYLSTWLGSCTWAPGSGGYSYPSDLKFQLLDETTGKPVFTGPVEIAMAANQPEQMVKDMNFNMTDVMQMDFSSFGTPGRYRLYVEGIGCGYPFDLSRGTTWEHAFLVQMKGLYHQRGGIALGPPHTDFVKPRDHHPDDGFPIFLTKWAQSIWQPGRHFDRFEEMAAEVTTERVTNAWGGYHDAGDWNPRRVSHMQVTLAQLELMDLFPEFFAGLQLNIPRDYEVPDMFNEALFEIDCFRRMQTPGGGVGYGIETFDPGSIELSWLSETKPMYMASPDAGNSWFYAAVAARAARLLKPYDAKLAKVYGESALKAMTWAESEFARQAKELNKTSADLAWKVRDSRNLAAIEMLRLTKDKKWHEIFLQDSVLAHEKPKLFAWGTAIQDDAAFAYYMAEPFLTDPVLRQKAGVALAAFADIGVNYGKNNAFNLVSCEKTAPMIMGFYSTPVGATPVLRAYHVTGEPKYLTTAIMASQFCSGANPDNVVFTTGLGANPIQNALKLDSRFSGQKTPAGLTVYGPGDYVNSAQSISFGFWILPMLNKVMTPSFLKWPVPESYCDVEFFIPQNEFTTDIWKANVFAWGYLSARPVTPDRGPAQSVTSIGQ